MTLSSNIGIYGAGQMKQSSLRAYSDCIGLKNVIDTSGDAPKTKRSAMGVFEVKDFDNRAVDIETTVAKTAQKFSSQKDIGSPLSEDARLSSKKIDFRMFKDFMRANEKNTRVSLSTPAGLFKYKIDTQSALREMVGQNAFNTLFAFDRAELVRQSRLSDDEFSSLLAKGFIPDHIKPTTLLGRLQQNIYDLKRDLRVSRDNNLSIHFTTLNLPASSPYRFGQPQSTVFTLKANNVSGNGTTAAHSVRVSFKPYGFDAPGFVEADRQIANYLGHKGQHDVLILPDIFNKELDFDTSRLVRSEVRKGLVDGAQQTPFRITEHFNLPMPNETTKNELAQIITWAEKRYVRFGGERGAFATPYLRGWLNLKVTKTGFAAFTVGASLLATGFVMSRASSADAGPA